MNGKFMSVIACAAGLLLPTAALAQSAPSFPADSTALVQRLEQQERIDEFKAKCWSQEPITEQNYDVQEKQDKQLVDRIAAGEQVSQDEVTQALRRVDTDY
jgi:hypothetical protein